MTSDLIQIQLAETIHKIVDAVHPKRIVLFGSSARNERTEHSDYDLLVIMPDGVNCNQIMGDLYVLTMNKHLSYDFVVISENRLQQHQNNPGLIYQYALKEGVELYAA